MKYLFLFAFLFFFISCKKVNEKLDVASLEDYFPLRVGAEISYNLDSTVFVNFGQSQVVVRYQAQDRVDAQITDNLGRPSYRVVRFIRKDSSKAWVPSNTFMVTQTNNSIEYVEDNLRYIKLQEPIRNDFSWKGNKYIDTYTTNLDVRYLDDWDYVYDSVGVPLTINGLTFDSTLKIAERDEFLGQDPSLPNTQYAEKNFSEEKYGKGVGLIYRDFLHWEYQGPQPGRPGYYVGYGVRLSITGYK